MTPSVLIRRNFCKFYKYKPNVGRVKLQFLILFMDRQTRAALNDLKVVKSKSPAGKTWFLSSVVVGPSNDPTIYIYRTEGAGQIYDQR